MQRMTPATRHALHGTCRPPAAAATYHTPVSIISDYSSVGCMAAHASVIIATYWPTAILDTVDRRLAGVCIADDILLVASHGSRCTACGSRRTAAILCMRIVAWQPMHAECWIITTYWSAVSTVDR